MNFKSFLLTEKLKLSVAKQYAKAWNKERYSEWFDGKYRVYLPMAEGSSKDISIPADVELALDAAGYEVIDYQSGTAKRFVGDKRIYKIGSVLTQHIKKMKKDKLDSVFIRRSEKALKAFQSDPARGGSTKKKALVVISRHPVDIAGMSTDRGWTSCMDLEKGFNRHYCYYDVKEGTLVAYLINPDDKNINHPIGRIAIKPFINIEGKVYLVPENSIYGTDLPGFSETVQKWLDEKQAGIFGHFKKNPSVYHDTGKTHVTIIDPSYLDDKVIEYRDGLTAEKALKEFPWLINCRAKNLILGQAPITDDRLIVYGGEWLTGGFSGIWKGGTFRGGIFEDGVFEGGEFVGGRFKGDYFTNGLFKGGEFLLSSVVEWAAPDSSWKSGKLYIGWLSEGFESKANPSEGLKILDEVRKMQIELEFLEVDEILSFFEDNPIQFEPSDLTTASRIYKKLLDYGFTNGLEAFKKIKDPFMKWIDRLNDKAFA